MAVSALIAVVYHFFVFAVDYTRTEYVQFEDDDYYYYVKAVPKSFITRAEKSIKNISSEPGEKSDDEETAPVERVEGESFDFEKQLEESLKDL